MLALATAVLLSLSPPTVEKAETESGAESGATERPGDGDGPDADAETETEADSTDAAAPGEGDALPDLEPVGPEESVPVAPVQPATPEQAQDSSRSQPDATTPPPPPPTVRTHASRGKHGDWRLVASPLASLVLPGAGQVLNGQGGKGAGILTATAVSLAGAIVLYQRPNDGTRPLGREYARLTGFGVLSTAVPILWLYGIGDAYTTARGRKAEPRVDHKLRISGTRNMTVGFRADANRPGFYDEWTLSLMGQAFRRFHVGVSDLTFKYGSLGDTRVWQFGLRADYRVYDPRRLWIDLGVGVSMQVVGSNRATTLETAADPDASAPRRELRFGATPFGHLNLRYFVLDRLSLDFTPRLSVPVTTRHYSANRALPRFGPILEFGAGTSLYW